LRICNAYFCRKSAAQRRDCPETKPLEQCSPNVCRSTIERGRSTAQELVKVWSVGGTAVGEGGRFTAGERELHSARRFPGFAR
jgi:hypothetical protein